MAFMPFWGTLDIERNQIAFTDNVNEARRVHKVSSCVELSTMKPKPLDSLKSLTAPLFMDKSALREVW